MVPFKAYFKINFLLALIKLSVSQTLLNSYFKLYARDSDVTTSFWSQYQLVSAGFSRNIGLTECISYCSRLNGCYSVSLSRRNDSNFCRVFNSVPVISFHITQANSSNVYVDAVKKRSFNMTCIKSEECDEANGLSCIKNVCKCFDKTLFWSLFGSKCMQCINGWYANYDLELCFMYFPNLLNWLDASSFCKTLHGSLVVFKSESIFNFLINVSFNFTSATNYSIWVGSTTTVIKQFKWSYGGSIPQSFFAPLEPNNHEITAFLNEGCLEMSQKHNYYLNDAECLVANAFYCSL